MQFALFPVSLYLQRICAEKNEWRYYAMSIQPDLFGGAFLMRRWGRIGTAGHLRLDQYADEGAATNALAHLAQKKLKRGYRVIAQDALLFS
ncbi:WGR domain-containing protein [Acetobacter okinawensis]|nr:WGR domain-containing protein [Acetobacter okinawensis]